MTLKWVLLASALALPLLAAAGEPSPCKPSDMKIEQVKVRGAEPGYTLQHVTGRMVNNCSKPIGAQVKIIYYGKGKEILKVQDVWPASVNNVEPRGDYPFDLVFEPIQGFEQLEIRVNRVEKW